MKKIDTFHQRLTCSGAELNGSQGGHGSAIPNVHALPYAYNNNKPQRVTTQLHLESVSKP